MYELRLIDTAIDSAKTSNASIMQNSSLSPKNFFT